MKKLVILAAALLLGALAGWAQQDAAAIYADKCASCHGPDGSANNARARKMKMKSVKETVSKISAPEMVKIVEGGKGLDMPAFGKQLDKQQTQSVVEHYRGFAK